MNFEVKLISFESGFQNKYNITYFAFIWKFLFYFGRIVPPIKLQELIP